MANCWLYFKDNSHKNKLEKINGVLYCLRQVMVEGSCEEKYGYSTIEVYAAGTIRIMDFREQKHYYWG